MVSISDLKLIFDGVNTWLQSNQHQSQLESEEYENALNAIYRATTETKSYISTLARRNTQDIEKEKKLSKLWNKAGIKLRTIDHDLAQRCIIKADYWANPDEWTLGDIKKSKIALDEIIKESRNLI